MKYARITAILLVIIAIIWVGGNIMVKGNQLEELGATAADDQKIVDAVVIVHPSVAQDKYRTLRLFGQTSANRNITITAKTSGEVEEILFERGQYIEEGALMLRLSPDNRPLELKQAEANLKEAQAQYDSISKLVEQKYRSSNELIAAEAQVAIAEASLENIKLDIEYTEIKAPFSGIADDNLVDVGSFVTAGTAITQFLELEPLKVVVNVSENFANFVDRSGQAVVQINGEEVEGKIENISQLADVNTRTFAVEVVLDNPGHKYSAGQTAIVILPIQKVKAHLISPAFIAIDEDGRFGIKTVEDDIVQFYAANLVEDTTEGMWIGGVPDEINLITQGAAYVSPGQKVASYTSQEQAHQAVLAHEQAEQAEQADKTTGKGE
ncbi:MAG: efflux RND transporter periplasmic adaptor subunit [Alphaproteobacteria bacterium]